MQQILEKMKEMRLQGMARSLQQTMESGKNEKFTADEMIVHLVNAEWDERYNKKMDRSVKQAKFRYKASVEQVTYEDNRLDKNQFLRLAECTYIKRKENILLTGSPGIG